MPDGVANDLDEMCRRFQGAGLTVPPVPSALRPSVRKLGDWVFATREVDPMAMYLFRDPAAMVTDTPDFVAVSHAGHGVNSYSINYQLRYGPVAVCAQVAWGGVYSDPETTAADVRQMFDHCARLIAAVEATTPRFEGSARCLLVVQSDFRRASLCHWLDRPPPQHQEQEPALTTAIRLISQA
jgi:hypothetical protein